MSPQSRSPRGVRVATAAPAFVERATAAELDDWLSYFEPDVVALTGDEPAPRAANAVRRSLDPGTVFFDATDPDSGGHSRVVDGLGFAFASRFEDLADLTGPDPEVDGPTFVLSPLLGLDVDRTSLSTELTGRDRYAEALAASDLDGECVHVSVGLPASYRREWDGLTVVGGGDEAGRAGTPLVALDCRADGRVLRRELPPGRLGLRALDGVGSQRAQSLRTAGFGSRTAVASAEPSALADLRDFGPETAERVRESARAVADGEIVRRSDAPLPDGEPVYIDIETDGLSPTITWLIGVLDGADGSYRSFLQTDPTEPGGAVEEFLSWYDTEARDRPLVAYNGWRFDFPVLRDHVLEYVPYYESVWSDSRRFDPYRWAVEEGNAVLPGRTNKLEDVAAALGYDRAEPGLTGAAVARTYRQWIAVADAGDADATATEPDWERFERYCEDDVRALAAVHQALEASGRIVSTDTDSRDPGDETVQGTLSEW
jgi:uncharacterized protein YprB with RNaseH-like and TPR domain